MSEKRSHKHINPRLVSFAPHSYRWPCFFPQLLGKNPLKCFGCMGDHLNSIQKLLAKILQQFEVIKKILWFTMVLLAISRWCRILCASTESQPTRGQGIATNTRISRSAPNSARLSAIFFVPEHLEDGRENNQGEPWKFTNLHKLSLFRESIACNTWYRTQS